MSSRHLSGGSLALLFLAAASLLVACEETVDPILPSNRQISLFGTLDMNADVQFIRVVPVRRTIAPQDLSDTGIELASTDLTTGRMLAWSDSVVVFDDGAVGLVFYAALRIEAGHAYRIEATLPGSALITSAVTTVPTLPAATVGPEDVLRFTTPQGANVRGSQQVVWEDLETEPFTTEMWYRFLRTPDAPFVDLQVPLAEFDPVFSSGALDISRNLVKDYAVLDTMIELSSSALMGLGSRVTLLDGLFVPPGGVFDPEVLVQPGTLSNVENGFGFVGSVGRFSAEWVLAEQSVRDLGYLTVEDAFGKTGAEQVRARMKATSTR